MRQILKDSVIAKLWNATVEIKEKKMKNKMTHFAVHNELAKKFYDGILDKPTKSIATTISKNKKQ